MVAAIQLQNGRGLPWVAELFTPSALLYCACTPRACTPHYEGHTMRRVEFKACMLPCSLPC